VTMLIRILLVLLDLIQWLPLNRYYGVFSAISMVYLHLLELSENCVQQCDEHDSDKKHAVLIFITSKLCDYNLPFTHK
jgi:hypothetical protein